MQTKVGYVNQAAEPDLLEAGESSEGAHDVGGDRIPWDGYHLGGRRLSRQHRPQSRSQASAPPFPHPNPYLAHRRDPTPAPATIRARIAAKREGYTEADDTSVAAPIDNRPRIYESYPLPEAAADFGLNHPLKPTPPAYPPYKRP